MIRRVSLVAFTALFGLSLLACSQESPLSSIPDCAGIVGGDATIDECGVCNGDNSQCADCDGIPNGDATLDACGVCNGDDSTCEDCAGVPNGDAVIDDCGVCGGDHSSCADCAGTPNGDAALDECGVCNGDSSSCADCHGVPNGDALEDECGVCDNDPTNDCAKDCSGEWGGDAALDDCGVCMGDNSTCADCSGVPNGDALEDECGVCLGDNSTCLDCNGDINGVAVLDDCGVCGGDGSTCDQVTLLPVADALVYSGSPNTNYGLLEELRVDRSVDETYIRFDLAATIPNGATIESARFETHAYHGFAWGSDGNVYTHLVADDTWQEDAITWNNKPAISGESLGSWWLWYDYNDYSERTGALESVAFTAAIQQELDADGFLSLRLNSPGYRTNYRSREFADPAAHPRIMVGYRDCVGILNGDAFVDTCGDCVGGITELEAGDCTEPDAVDPEVNVGDVTTVLTQQGNCGYGDNVITCPTGSVAVGYEGRTGAWFDHMRLICQSVSTDGTLGTSAATSANGSSTGGSLNGPHYCPTGSVMVGAHVRAGDHLDYVQGRCMTVAEVVGSSLNFSSSASAMGNPWGGEDFGDSVCPAGHAITGMVGGFSQYACRVSWMCTDLSDH